MARVRDENFGRKTRLFGRNEVPPDSPGAALLVEAGPTEAEEAQAAEGERRRRERERIEAAAFRTVEGEVARAEQRGGIGG